MLRVKSFLGMLAALPALSNAAVLQLVGESSTLEMNGAKLRSWCTTDESAEVLGMTPTEFRGIVGGNVTVLFRNVPATCVNSPISQPCAESLGILPPLFQCHLNGPGGSFSTAEDRAFTRVVKPTEGSSDLILGTAIVMSCPLPPHETLVSVAGYQGETGEAWVHLNITYSGVEIPFAGVPDGSRIHFLELPKPPSSPPPPPDNPPPSPPIAPIQLSCKGFYDAGARTDGLYNLITSDGLEFEVPPPPPSP